MSVRLPPFQALLDDHGRDVYRFLVASVGVTDADDCYQEAWLSALRAYPGLKDTTNLRAWIFTIAHRKALDHHRGRARRAVPVPDTGDGRASKVPAAGDNELWAHVAGLPDKQRTALALRFIGDASYIQIATTMETSEEAARRSVHEALKRLRKEYRP
jgi:RNA polymerase sigma factor (sigma-70 family)